MRKPLLLSFLLGVLSMSHLLSGNELQDPSFIGRSSAWRSYQDGFAWSERGRLDAGGAALRQPADWSSAAGLSQQVRYDRPDRRPVSFSGWCRTSGGAGGEIVLHLDLTYDDGTQDNDKLAFWNNYDHDWEYTEGIFYPAKPVREINLYAYLRNTGGEAWLDDLALTRDDRARLAVLRPANLQLSDDVPCSLTGLWLTADYPEKVRWTAKLFAGEREVDSISGSGGIYWHAHPAERPERLELSAADGELETLLVYPVPHFGRPESLPGQGFDWFVTSSMDKVYPDAPAPEKPRREIDVALARRESGSVQLSLAGGGDAASGPYRLETAQLLREDGTVFPENAVGLYRTGFVRAVVSARHPGDIHYRRPAWIPDPLLPYSDIFLGNGGVETVWIDFSVAEDTPPGVYTGQWRLLAPQGAEIAVPVRLEVHDFVLPPAPAFRTAFSLMDGFIRKAYGEISPELRRQCLDVMLDHRLNPDDISRTQPPAIEDLLYAEARGMNAFNIVNLVPVPDPDTVWVWAADASAFGDEFNRELAERLDPYIAELRRHDLVKYAYFYGFDEQPPEMEEVIHRTFRFVKERYPDIPTFTTAGFMYHKREDAAPDFQDYLDWYCPFTRTYDPALSQRLRSEGKRCWWYVCCDPIYPYANFAPVNYPAIEGRLLGWMAYRYRSDGLLYWLVNDWRQPPIEDTGRMYLDWRLGVFWVVPGDGILVYPTAGGPIPSVRLKNIRDGQNDYDYLALLEEALGRPAAERYAGQLVETLTEFSRDSRKLEALRREIAREIVRAKK